MAEFLEKDNICGQNVLQIVGVGNAIIAELLRLKDYIPDVFRLATKEHQTKYADIILDFKYFKISDSQDKKIEDDPVLQELDDNFRDNYIEILTRFYLAFESIHQYIVDLNNFVQELNDGMYIQQTLETVLQDEEGKQMLAESLYLYGVMLLIVDLHIPGIIRERLMVSYHRYSAQNIHGDSNIDDVCKLLRSTGFHNQMDTKRLPNYPDEYFRRVVLDEIFVEMVIGRLISDDIYNQTTVYPLPEHRTTAIANQAGMLYVCLFFSPQTLHKQNARMREIVDKFFSDNWIVSIYMGITVNLVDSWDTYKAAKNALQQAIDFTNIRDISTKHSAWLIKLLPKSTQALKEGALTESFLIQNITKIINLIRGCNVTLRWLMLHTTPCIVTFGNQKKCKQIRDQVISESNFKPIELFELLLSTSQLEVKSRDIIKHILATKESRWNNNRKESSDRITELSEVFSGEKPLIRIEKNENLKAWLSQIAKEIDSLNYNTPNISGRKIIQIIQALEEVQEFHNLDSNMQIKQTLHECRQFLHQMIQMANIKEETLINIQLIGDLSYAWKIIDRYTSIMQENIVKQPNLVHKLRATFLKLASALEIPLLRINQAQSEDLVSVSQYYSNELVHYVRKVVQIIPETMFGVLAKIIHLQTEVIKELPTRLEKDRLKEYAQLEDRYMVAKLTYSISVFTEGILMMKKTLVGVIELDPKQLLEDGIRKELVNHLANTLHSGLIFNPKSKNSELETKLNELAKRIDGYRRSFEYIQDYLNIYGSKIWHQEMSRIINYNVEQECNEFLRKKVQDWQSEYQTDTIPIPTFAAVDTSSVNFIGRLAREILKQSDPKVTIHIELDSCWRDYKTQKELLSLRFFSQITESIGPVGLVGLDKLFSHMIVADLEQLLAIMQKNIIKEKAWTEMLQALAKEITPNTFTVNQPTKIYASYINRCVKIFPVILDWILKIGQKQILRKLIAFELNKSCKFNAKNLESSLRTLNEAILMEIKLHEVDSSSKTYPSTSYLAELNKYLEWAGIHNPYHKIYVTTKNSPYYALFLFLLTIAHVPKMQYTKNISSLTAIKISDSIDGAPFVVGIATVLKQFHKDILVFFMECTCQYVLSLVNANLTQKREICTEASVVLCFLKLFIKVLGISNDVLEKHIPEVILNQFEYLSTKV